MNCVHFEDNTELCRPASELVSDKFICTYLGQANHIYLYYRGNELYMENSYRIGMSPRGGYFRNFWVGMCRWDPGTLNLYQS